MFISIISISRFDLLLHSKGIVVYDGKIATFVVVMATNIHETNRLIIRKRHNHMVAKRRTCCFRFHMLIHSSGDKQSHKQHNLGISTLVESTGCIYFSYVNRKNDASYISAYDRLLLIQSQMLACFHHIDVSVTWGAGEYMFLATSYSSRIVSKRSENECKSGVSERW